MRAYVIVPNPSRGHEPLLEVLDGVPDIEVLPIPATMLRSIPEGFDMGGPNAFHRRDMKPGEIGAALSHQGIYHEIVREAEPWALVFEDDARIVDASEFRRAIDEIRRSSIVGKASVVTLYSENVVVTRWLSSRLGRCWFAPYFSLAYLITPMAAARLIEANSPVQFVCDWPDAPGVDFYFYESRMITHGDQYTSSIIGDRAADLVGGSSSGLRQRFAYVADRMSLYSFVHYVRHRSHFNGLGAYYRIILRRRIVDHLSRTLFRRRVIREGLCSIRTRPAPNE